MPKIGVKDHQPYWQTKDHLTAKIWKGDVLENLRKLPTGSVHCVVTSPPYWALRDYGTGEWSGGDSSCDHTRLSDTPQIKSSTLEGSKSTTGHQQEPWKNSTCGRCGAVRNDRQLGSEEVMDCENRKVENCAEVDWNNGCHVCRMVLVFRELRRVLREDGVLWLNYGDTYASGGRGGGAEGSKQQTNKGSLIGPINNGVYRQNSDHRSSVVHHEGYKSPFRGTATDGSPYLEQGKTTGGSSGLPAGNLCGVPWRVALALQADGWVLRQDIAWCKSSPMPESVTNRCTKAHEFIFLLTKIGSGYYYDATVIREKRGNKVSTEEYEEITAAGPCASGGKDNYAGANKSAAAPAITHPDGANKRDVWTVDDENALLSFLQENYPDVVGEYLEQSQNKKDTWVVSSQGYAGCHYATFSERLITPCILSSTSSYGCCDKCFAPYRRVTESTALKRERPNEYVKRTGEEGTGNSCSNTVAGVEVKTLNWVPTCNCYGLVVKKKGKKKFFGRWTNNEENKEAGYDFVRYKDADPEPQEIESKVEEYRWLPQYVDNPPPVVPCTVLDPFLGSGTSIACALDHGLRGWGIELSQKYIDDNAIPRVSARLFEKGLSHLIPQDKKAVEIDGDEVIVE